jgi:phosphohistidine swiveling domain-containing protein
MTEEELKNKVLSYEWDFWADRPFGAFIMSLFKDGQTREYIRRVGVDAEWPVMLFQKSSFYKSVEVWDIFADEVQKSIKSDKTIFNVVKKCEDFRTIGLDSIIEIINSHQGPLKKLSYLYEILTQIVIYVWLAHGFEHIYSKKLKEEVPKYFDGEIESVIGDLVFPVKKNAHYYFEESLKSDESIKDIERRFAWIKARDGFSSGFSKNELEVERKRLKSSNDTEKDFIHPHIPKKLKDLVDVARELVYFRTLRTDILYELMYFSRPILFEVAQKYDLTFEELQDYSVFDLINGKLEKYEFGKFSAISFGKDFALIHGDLIKDKKLDKVTEIKGIVAFKGKIRGKVKIAITAYEADKIKEGDILVAPTTAPSFIMAMKKASAFVTDEGGITSHAAITSREMKKPCIIGTKIATRVLEDGDKIEVNADKGIVKILDK